LYHPQKNLLTGIENLAKIQLLPWDEYFPTMGEADFLLNRHEKMSVKSFFIRKAPFNGSYALLGGITAALRTINELSFDNIFFGEALRDLKYSDEYISYLQKRKNLHIQVYSGREGQIFFENEPIISVVGSLHDIRLAEGIITEAVNFPSLSLTKWSRLVRAGRPGSIMEFARRRSQNSLLASLYSQLAGCTSTSNSEIRRFFDFHLVGTMGHEWIQSFGDVRLAFSAWLDVKPGKAIGLVDTKQCLEHDFPIWLDEVLSHKDKIIVANPAMWGWRNDSGDLAYLAIEQYRMFMSHELAKNEWFRDRMRIVMTNDLDEYAISSITSQIYTNARSAGFDGEDIVRRIIWAAGTKPGTCDGNPSLGGVAKLMSVEGSACIKLAFDAEGNPCIKTSIPGWNKSFLIFNEKNEFQFTLIAPSDKYMPGENNQLVERNSQQLVKSVEGVHPNNEGNTFGLGNYQAYPQQKLVFDSFTKEGFTDDWNNPNIDEIPGQIERDLDAFGWRYTRLEKPEKPKVLLTHELFEKRQKMIMQGALREDFLE
jgi:nicotinate phosphoribosyltransferase